MVRRLLHTRLRVNDLDRTVAFYTNVLGLRVVRKHTSPRGSQLVFLAVPNSTEEIEICYFPQSGTVVVPADLVHLAFEVEDLESFGRHCSALGYPFTEGPTQTSSGSLFAFLNDPDGYEIELIQRSKTISS